MLRHHANPSDARQPPEKSFRIVEGCFRQSKDAAAEQERWDREATLQAAEEDRQFREQFLPAARAWVARHPRK